MRYGMMHECVTILRYTFSERFTESVSDGILTSKVSKKSIQKTCKPSHQGELAGVVRGEG